MTALQRFAGAVCVHEPPRTLVAPHLLDVPAATWPSDALNHLFLWRMTRLGRIRLLISYCTLIWIICQDVYTTCFNKKSPA